ncbi:phosphoadenylyl-sulfate reductase [Antribacter sp. KLBMP9083]|uniref:Adenosine 5'-phosphosulfate reductase n=1 Tax=Antribacter soli TaxID=2910976 RepID=A0AA41QGH1_9MICO|nr:phosphoadenylyl-sulfate reductase [Antribacter soli]MCF4122678.1 phosphoadenylyl-sulfate reductase [Antribacter soli]
MTAETTSDNRLAQLRARAQARQAARTAAREAYEAQRAGGSRRRRSLDELRAIAARGQAELHGAGFPGAAPDATAEATAEQVVAWAVREFGPGLAVASSMQDTVLAHLVSQQLPWVDVLFGDTGYHFAETLGTRGAVELDLDVHVVDVKPRLSVEQQDAAHGKDLFARDPEACCAMRKVAPMHDALQGYEAWATGLRRGESASRATAPLVTFDEKNGVVKINPLAGWSDDQVADYVRQHGLIVNPLLSEGYPSIGCEPCTRRVEAGADSRSGRWAGLDKTECGLHV